MWETETGSHSRFSHVTMPPHSHSENPSEKGVGIQDLILAEWDPIPVPARMFKSQYQTNIGKNTFSQGFSLQKFHKIAKHQKHKYNNNFTKKNNFTKNIIIIIIIT